MSYGQMFNPEEHQQTKPVTGAKMVQQFMLISQHRVLLYEKEMS